MTPRPPAGRPPWCWKAATAGWKSSPHTTPPRCGTRYAATTTESALRESGGEDGLVRLKEPLVSAVFKEKPLNEVVAKLAELGAKR